MAEVQHLIRGDYFKLGGRGYGRRKGGKNRPKTSIIKCGICGKPLEVKRESARRYHPKTGNTIPGQSCEYIATRLTKGLSVKKPSLRKIKMNTPGYAGIASPEENIPPEIRESY